MTCESIREDLAAYLDGEFGADRAARIEGHLKTCSECRSESEVLAERIELLRFVPHPAAPPELWARIYAAVAAAPRRMRMPGFAARATLAAAAAIVLAVAMGSGIPYLRDVISVPGVTPRAPMTVALPNLGITDMPDDMPGNVSRIRTEADVLRLFDQAQDFAEVNDYKRAAGLLRLAEKAMAENGIKVSAETKTNIERLGSSIDGHLK